MAQVTLGTGRRASHSKAEGKAQSGDPTGQRSEQEGAPPHPQVLTWNTPAGRHGAGTVCSPRATMLLMSRARCENHAERPRGRRCTCSREAAEPALALATVSESPPCGEQCGPIREEFSSLLPLTLRIMDPPHPSRLLSMARQDFTASVQLCPTSPPSPMALQECRPRAHHQQDRNKRAFFLMEKK